MSGATYIHSLRGGVGRAFRYVARIYMTVRREASTVVRLDPLGVSRIVAQVLADGQRDYSYIDTTFSESQTSATTTIRPNCWPWYLSTRFSIDIEKLDDQRSTVRARTESQRFLLGDVFNFYGGYLSDFLLAVHESIARAK